VTASFPKADAAPGGVPLAVPRERAWRDLPRLLVIVRRLTPLVLSLLRDRRRWLWFGTGATRSRAFHERRAARIVREIAALGPAFVKLAQIFAARADLIPEPYLGALASLTDQVPPEPWSAIRSTLARAWQADPDTVVESLDPVPLAAGSLGQVHRATYAGLPVVVKVLRPGVEAIVTRDVRLARAIVSAVYRRWPHVHVHGVRVVLDEFAAHVGDEMDFEHEAVQCERMRTRFADEPRLRIPRVIPGLTRREVLVLEYLEGTRVDQLDQALATGRVSLQALLETLIATYARMMLRDGVFHADPHPGNLLVDTDGRLVLLDFGMVIDVPAATRRALFDTILAAIRRDAPGTTRGFEALGMVAPGTDPAVLEALVETLLGIAYSETATIERARVLADRVMRELFNWPILLPGELVYFARTAALIEGIGARYDRQFNSIRVASPVVLRLRHELFAAMTGDGHPPTRLEVASAALGYLTGRAVRTVRRFLREGVPTS
jgi:predicted unusual protein kinase regulating ubiquinone biosynthesis (AarF/ABC1/UbiB family)